MHQLKRWFARTFPSVHCICLLLTVGAAGLGQTPNHPVLNEILYFEDLATSEPIRTHEWVEIYNSGPDLNLTGWVVSNRTGRSGSGARGLPAIIMPQGTYLIVHFATGTNDNNFTNGMRNYYTGDPAGINLFNNSSDRKRVV